MFAGTRYALPANRQRFGAQLGGVDARKDRGNIRFGGEVTGTTWPRFSFRARSVTVPAFAAVPAWANGKELRVAMLPNATACDIASPWILS
jgi:hypothetical protein